MPNTFKLGVFASQSGWHFQDLSRAAQTIDIELELTSLDFQRLSSLVHVKQGSAILADNVPVQELDCVLVRIMPTGSLEQIIVRMDILNRLAASGVRVINPPRSVEIAVDKYLSLALLAEAGIAVPRSGVSQTVDDAMQMLVAFGGTAVMKPLFGSLGNGLRLVKDTSEGQKLFSEAVERKEVIYLQELVDHRGVDFRFFVIGDNVWSIKRTAAAGNWITNVYQGGTPSQHNATTEEVRLALRAACATGCEIAGVDVAYDQSTGQPFVLEVNAAPGWQAISSTLNVDFAAEILTYCASSK